jgi:hypothetical protein
MRVSARSVTQISSCHLKVKVKVKLKFTLEQATEAQRVSIDNLYFYGLL